MINIVDKTLCCGCEACVQICPKHCISFDEDAEGFSYPVIDQTSCIDCGLCEKICHEIHPFEEKKPIRIIAANNKKKEVRLNSSSGGIFTCLAENCIKEGGVVFGARFDENWEIIITETDNIDDLNFFRGSKYVQAKIGDSFKKTKEYLDGGRKVLFSGTPCQIAGLNHFLKKEYKDLLTVDFVCHGVPSPMVWRKYLEEVKQKEKKDAHKADKYVRIKSISFRDKISGWKKYSFTLTLATDSADGKKNSVSFSHIYNEDIYMKAFLTNLILRPSCYVCPSKCGKSHADITMADFWGIENVKPEMDDDIGTSLVLINSTKGESSIPFSEMSYSDTTYEIAKTCNPSIWRSPKCHPKREHFFSQLSEVEFISKQIERELRKPLNRRIVMAFKRLVKRFIGRC